MDLNSICGLPLAFLMIREADDGDDDWSILRTGVIRIGDGFALDLGPGRAPVPMPNGLETQIKSTPESLLELLDGAEYYIPFIIEDLASGEANDFVVSLGFKWPGSEETS